MYRPRLNLHSRGEKTLVHPSNTPTQAKLRSEDPPRPRSNQVRRATTQSAKRQTARHRPGQKKTTDTDARAKRARHPTAQRTGRSREAATEKPESHEGQGSSGAAQESQTTVTERAAANSKHEVLAARPRRPCPRFLLGGTS